MLALQSVASRSTDVVIPAYAGSTTGLVRKMACQLDSSPSSGDRKSRDRPEIVGGAAAEQLRDAIYRSSRAGWSRDQSARRLRSRDDKELPPTGNSNITSVVGESLIAREMREQQQREEELATQRRISTCDVIDCCAVAMVTNGDVTPPCIGMSKSNTPQHETFKQVIYHFLLKNLTLP